MNTNYETILFEVENEIATITVNRPKALNALSHQVHSEINALLKEFMEANKDFTIAKGMILTGAEEKAFIAGADIKEMTLMSADEAEAFARLGQDNTLLFELLNIPVIACVNGYALGGGCEMAMSCDFIFATKTAVFGQPEVKLGLIPGFGGTQRLSKLVGRNRAKEITYSGRNVAIEEAKEIGLVVSVFESKEEMIEAAKVYLSKAMRNSPHAIYEAKRVMNEGNDLTITDGLNVEAKAFGAIFNSADMREGTAAFVEKRKPVFIGK
ncbi:enoyl-CoA hydratase-related protein [Halobacteriovorax sp. JY17]|uniref:enoyl-CoA hydratase/isomerase family protein n=1 Tax=Halobacteriovorax sp. JY17 TaxID=2014617 RepID=UPI0025B95A2C|nr:enoyl-CoA hydratase-related protein [Halobacteriovorax sp. JY17]